MFSLLSLLSWITAWFAAQEPWMRLGMVSVAVCLLFALRSNTRRPALLACALIGIGIYTWHYLKVEYDSYQPGSDTVVSRQRWLR